jgi:hypothetical protein
VSRQEQSRGRVTATDEEGRHERVATARILLQRIGEVIVVTVRESESKPVQYSDGYFWRQGAVTQKLSRDEIRDLFRSEGTIRFDTSVCPKFRYPQDFEFRRPLPAGLCLRHVDDRL